MASRDYLYSNSYSKIDELILAKGSTYFYGYSPEERSHCVDTLIEKHKNSITFVAIQETDKDCICDTMTGVKYHLRSSKIMTDFLRSYQAETVYIDVTGLDNRVCAALIRNAFEALGCIQISDIRTIYAEPESYVIKEFSSEGVFHDLSEKIDGIDPLPGFASIVPEVNEDVVFVPLLGFEGGRLTHLLEEFQPPEDNIFPIIGVPGFRFEYPFVAYWGNRQSLKQTGSWRNIRYAAANSLVDVYELFSKIQKKYPGCRMKIAPIGTKPHAIGAMLYAIKESKSTELIYDNPKRKKQRTVGVGNIIESFVSKLYQER